MNSINPKKPIFTLSKTAENRKEQSEIKNTIDHLPLVPDNHPMREQIDANIVGHEADFLILNTYFEGLPLEKSKQHLSTFVDLCQKQSFLSNTTSEKLQSFFQNLYILPQDITSEATRKRIAQEIANKVFYLEPGQTFSMEGGWIEKENNGSFGGHAMIYSFTKKSSGHYDVYIYNTGSGARDFHHAKIAEEGIKKSYLYCPYVKFQDVEIEKLGCSQNKPYPEFFEKILKISAGLLPSNLSPTQALYCSRDGFGGCYNHLVDADIHTPYMKPQRSGTCTLSVLFGAIHSHFTSKEEYKLFKFLLGYTDLSILFDKYLKSPRDLAVEQLLLYQAKKLLRSLEKRADLFSNEIRSTVQNRLEQIISHIEHLPKQSIDCTPHPLHIKNKELYFFPRSIQISDPLTSNDYKPTDRKWMEKKPTLNTLSFYLDQVVQSNDLYVIQSIEQLTEVFLSISPQEIDKLSKEQTMNLVSQLHLVLIKYIERQNKDYIKTSQVCRNTLWAFVCLSYELSCKVEPHLQDHTIAHDLLTEARDAELYIEYSPKENEVLQKILKRLKGSVSKTPIFDFANYLRLEPEDSLPKETYWLKEIAYPNNPYLNRTEFIDLLIKKEGLEESPLGRMLIQLRDIVYWAHTACPSNTSEFSSASVNHDFYTWYDYNLNLHIGSFNYEPNISKAWSKLWNTEFHDNTPFSTVQPENNTLCNPKDYSYSETTPPSRVSNQALRCSKQLYFAMQNKLHLQTPQEQENFFHLLFQSLPGQNPPIYSALEDNAFLEQCKDFIQEGIASFSTKWIHKKPNIFSCLFFLRFQRRLEEASSSVSLPWQGELLNTWLLRADLTPEEKKCIHLHRILQYKSTPTHKLSKKALIEIFSSWILCSNYLFSDTADGKLQKEEAFRFIFSLAPLTLTLSTDDLSDILNITVGSSIDHKDLSIDLLEGHIIHSGQIVSLGAHQDIRNFDSYQDIFGSMEPTFIEHEESSTFQDAQSNLVFRYAKESLQVCYEDVWYQYTPHEILSREVAFLSSDHHCFSNGTSRLFLHKTTREPSFIFKETLIHLSTQSSTLTNLNTSSIDLFEPKHWRLHELDAQGNTTLHFPRFTNQLKQELCLIKNERGEFLLREDPNFILIQPIDGILGSLQNKLCFSSKKTGEIKILIPNLPIKNQKTLGPTDTLFIESSKDGQQGKTRSYFEYTYKEGHLYCKDREAVAFLSYLYLIQRKEKESLNLLQSLGRELDLTPSIIETLHEMTSFFETPSATAIALTAAVHLKRHKQEIHPKILNSLIHRYRDNYSNIPINLQLSPRDLDLLNIEKSTEAIEHIYPTDWKIPKWNISYIPYCSENVRADFLHLYKQLYQVSSVEEKKCILAGFSIESLPDCLKAILCMIEESTSILPSPSSYLSHDYQAFEEFAKKVLSILQQDKKSYYYPALPTKEALKNTDSPLPQSNSLRSLSHSVKEAKVPSFSDSKGLNPSSFLHSPQASPFAFPSKLPPLYQAPLQKNLQEINEDLLIHQQTQVQKLSFLNVDSLSSLDEIIAHLQEVSQSLEDLLSQEQLRILHACKKLPKNTLQAEQVLRLQKGDMLPKIEFEELITCYLKGVYTHLNPHLKASEWQEIDLLIRSYLTQKTLLQQIKQALSEKDKVKLLKTLREEKSYIPSSDRNSRAFLVYEYRSGHRIRKVQMDAINNLLSNKNIVLQMMMGGGKTTLLTSLLLELLPKGKIPFFIPLPAQFETQVANLSTLQYKYYHKQIIPMQLKRSDITVEKLRWIEKKLSESQLYQEAIITTASSLECLQLEWIRLLDTPSSARSLDDLVKISLLTHILKIIKKDGISILDEVDQILDLFMEHNFPSGPKERIASSYVDCIATIFKLHLDPKIEESLSLLKGAQASYPLEDYKKHILPTVADKLFNLYKSQFNLEESHKKLFLDYVLLAKENPEFRELLEKRLQSNHPKDIESAQLIFLVKGVLAQILPIVMTKAINKNYGIPKGSADRKVIPFLGVDSPASTEFAGPYETACYHFLAALSSPITKEQILTLATKYMKQLLPVLQYSHIELQKTPEYITFLNLTGAALDKIYLQDPLETEKALAFTQKHPEKRLEIEKSFIETHVGMYTEYYQSNPQSFCHLFSANKGLTGTPWNALTYPESLKNHVFKEIGVESRIRSQILSNSDTGKSNVYCTSSQEVQATLAAALQNNPNKKYFRALLDPTGFFKDYSNEAVAQEILQFFADDPSIDTVLFFGRKEGNMGVPGTCMMLKKPKDAEGKFPCEIIGTTHKEALQAKGVDPMRTITYYDERHCEATDVPQMSGALGLMVAGYKLRDRDLLQACLRLRDYMHSQNIDFILPEKELIYYPSNPTGRDILLQAQITQEVQRADLGFISLGQKVHSLFREKAIENLLYSSSESIDKKTRNILVSKQSMEPYAIFGKIDVWVDPLKAFDLHKNKEESNAPLRIKKTTHPSLTHLRQEVEKNITDFPSLVPITESSHGMEIEMQVEMDVEMDHELELEYNFYQTQAENSPFKEIENPPLWSLTSLLRNKEISYKKPYYELFANAPFKVTENFARTEYRLLPIFHKKQKPAEQILITENCFELQATLVSTKEAEDYKQKILEGKKGMWLYLPDGHMHVKPPHGRTIQNIEKLEEILFEVNLFNGNSQYLLLHKDKFIQKIQKEPHLKPLFLHFLGLKALQNPVEKSALERLCLELPIFSEITKPQTKPYYQILWDKLYELLEKLLNSLEELGYFIVENLTHYQRLFKQGILNNE